MTGNMSDLGQLERVYTVSQIAKMLNLSDDTVYRQIKAGLIDAFRIGKGIRVKQTALDTYLDGIGYSTPVTP